MTNLPSNNPATVTELSVSHFLLLAALAAIPSRGEAHGKAVAVVSAAVSIARHEIDGNDGIKAILREIPHVRFNRSRTELGPVDHYEWKIPVQTAKQLGLIGEHGPFRLTEKGQEIGKIMLAGRFDLDGINVHPDVYKIKESGFFDRFIAEVRKMWFKDVKFIYAMADLGV